MQHGYSDRINHALAFAAKHHDVQVRMGLRAPYFTQPSNVAVILTRYGRDETTVVAGILHDLIATSAREVRTGNAILERISAKFGQEVLDTVLSVVPRRTDNDGVEYTLAESREDVLQRLEYATEASRWVLAAVQLHEAGTLMADLTRTQFPDMVWERSPSDRDATLARFSALHDRLHDVGFATPILHELGAIVEQLGQKA